MARPKDPLVTKLRDAGLSASYASEVASGQRQPSLRLALTIYRATGLKFGKLSGATPKAIRAIAEMIEV